VFGIQPAFPRNVTLAALSNSLNETRSRGVSKSFYWLAKRGQL